MYNNKLTKAIRLALVFGATTVLATPAFSQEVTEEEESVKKTERISVVGSRIRTDEFANETPIDIITVADAEQQGLKTLGELLRTSTSAGGSSQLTAALTVGYVTNGGTGAESASLRGLGANRTLVLLNGRRAGPAGTRGAVSSFDLNSIPLSAVERVEILKDGASALYGSDAVAGVINIITKKGDSKSITVDVSRPMESGGEDTRINFSYGEEFSDGSFRITGDFRKTAELTRGDRSYLDCTERLQFNEDGSRSDPIDPRTGQPHCQGSGFGLWMYGGVSSAYGGSLQSAYDYDGFFAENGYDSINAGNVGFTTPNGWYPVSYNDDYASEGLWDLTHPFQGKSTLVPETTSGSLYATGDYSINEDIMLYAEFIHSTRQTKTNSYRQFWTADIGAQHSTNVPGFEGDGWVFPVAITDHNSSKTTIDYTRAVIGATGDIGFWTWDVSYQNSYNDGQYAADYINSDAHVMSQEVWASGTPCAGQVTEFSGKTCVDVNWTDPEHLRGYRSAEQNDFLFGEQEGSTIYKQQTLEAYITGDLYELPAGEVGVAFGMQIQKDSINDTPGKATLDGNAWGSSGAGITKGDQTTEAIYAEFLVPLIEDVPGLNKVDLTASARYTDVDTYGSDTTWKLGLSWEIAEGYKIRASRGTSFRSPALYELFLAEQTGFGGQLAVDPCLDYENQFGAGSITETVYNNCKADGIPANYEQAGGSATLVTSGGDGRLKAETSVSEGIGFVFNSPEQTFAFSIDYFKVQISDEISNLGGANIVSRCYASTDFANEPLCDLFTRRDGSNQNDWGIDQVNGGYVNIAAQVARGVDYQFSYNDDFDFGSIRFTLDHTMQIERTSQLFEDSEYNNLISEMGNPKHNGVARLTYSNDDFYVTWAARYYDATNDYEYYASETNTTTLNGETVTFIDEARWKTLHTVSGGFEFNDFNFIVGVANVFDEEPAKISSSGFELGNAALYSQSDFVGRRIFANISYNF